MQGKQVFITGSTQGIGKAAATALARLGAAVTIHGRDAARAGAVAAEIRASTGNQAVDSVAFDLSSLVATRDALRRWQETHARLDVLCLNAGVFLAKREISVENHEKTVSTRFLGHFLVTQSLLPLLKASGEGRIITTAAPPGGMKANFDDLDLEQSYSTIKAVTQGMSLHLMSQMELAEQLRGQAVCVNFFHPGIIKTKLLAQMPLVFRVLIGVFGSRPEKGADTLVYLASDSSVRGVSGKFFVQRKPKPFKGAVADRENQKRAYALGTKLTSLYF
jgi:NAD(P)-dependent dehydrogenase (short-subunit alcohol dehydrogenase family)